MSVTGGYRLKRIAARGAQPSAYWQLLDYPALDLYCDHRGWQLRCTARPVPEWLSAQLRGGLLDPTPHAAGLRYWKRGPFATRRALLEALRVEQERAETSVPAARALIATLDQALQRD